MKVETKQHRSNGGWIGVDLDATLAHYERGAWKGIEHIGDPIPAMVDRVKAWIAVGQRVKIFTARVAPHSIKANDTTLEAVEAPIVEWCIKHIGRKLPVTHEKDMSMIELWDDRAVGVIPNTGLRADGKP